MWVRFALLGVSVVGSITPAAMVLAGFYTPDPLSWTWAACGLVGFGGLAWLTSTSIWDDMAE